MFQQNSHKEGRQRRRIWSALICLLLFSFSLFPVTIHKAQAYTEPGKGLLSAQDVINAVNQVRAARGLPAYQVNGALMAAAQAHSEYQASINSATHTGQGGSSVLARALAAGYGNGAAVSVIENIYSGMNATPQQAVNWWQGDSLHLSTLISTRHQDAGAGVARNGERVFYTLDVGGVSSAAGNAATQLAVTTSSDGQTPAASAAAFFPVLVSTPGPDGSVIHVVQPGQTLWTIAATYKISIADLLRINGLNDRSFILPGQKIIIQPPGSLPTATFEMQEASETEADHAATPTLRPTRTVQRSPTAIAQVDSAPPAPDAAVPLQRQSAAQHSARVDPLLAIIVGLVLGGVGLLVMGSVLRKVG